jgi:hypothetical protein
MSVRRLPEGAEFTTPKRHKWMTGRSSVSVCYLHIYVACLSSRPLGSVSLIDNSMVEVADSE